MFTEFLDPDPKTGDYLTTKTSLADGTEILNQKVLAYNKYPAMGSKVDNINNKHMLTQEAMNITTINNGSSTLNASITTWGDSWTYRDGTGAESTESGIWRKYKNFVWKDKINPIIGNYGTNVNNLNDRFNWAANQPVELPGDTGRWEQVSEITRYTHWSSPVETKDINNNFASSKMADNFSKVIAGGNARYSEMYYSGAEHVASGNWFEGEVQGADYRSSDVAHTGMYAVKNTAANNEVFKVSGMVGANHNDLSQDFRPGKYKVSFWTYIFDETGLGIHQTGTALKLNNVELDYSETVDAGCWRQFNYYVDLPPNSNFKLAVTNTIAGGYYFDDFRMHPVYASMNSFVYDQDTDELLYTLNANNMATAYRYDDAGRLKASYIEVENTGTNTGGFKMTNQYKYHYQGVPTTSGNSETIDNCLNNPLQ